MAQGSERETESKAKPTSYSVLGAVQTLLRFSEESVDALSQRVSIASSLLTRNPGLSGVALSVLASAYQFYLLQPDQASGVDGGLETCLRQAEEVIYTLLDHAPLIWSHRVLQWCMDVASLATRNQTMSSQSLDELLHVWLRHPKLRTIIALLELCTNNLVGSGRGEECVELMVKECLNNAPNLNWLLTHLLSLHPGSLLGPFLEQVLHLHPSPASPPFLAVGQILEFLGHSCRGVVGASVVSVVGRVVRGELGQRGRWGRQVALLLQLAPHCVGLLSFISQDCLQIVTADEIKAIVIAASSSGAESHDSHISSDEDEGEVKSDEDSTGQQGRGRGSDTSGSVEKAVVDVLGVLDREAAAQAISQLIQTYSCLADLAQSQEEAMEEGEIVHVSLVNVMQESCQAVLTKLLHQLHTASMASLTLGPRTGRGAVTHSEFTVGLQCGLQNWCAMMLQPNMEMKCREWLCSAVASVCVCAAELQAASALATLLLHCSQREHLRLVLTVYKGASVRFSQLAQSAVQSALTSCSEGAESRWLCENLWSIVVDSGAGVEDQTRSKFTAAVRMHLLLLSTVLCGEWTQWRAGDGCAVLKLVELAERVGKLERSGGDYSTHCQVVSNFLSFLFNCITWTNESLLQEGRVDLRAELCLGRCGRLLSGWVAPDTSPGSAESLKLFFLRSLVRRALSQDVSDCVGSVPLGRGARSSVLLPLLAVGASLPSGRAGSLQHIHHFIRSPPNDHYTTAVSHSTNHILSLLATVANGDSNLVISVLLDRVAPHLPSNSAPWLPGEGPRSTSLEWSLSVKQQFDQHPLLWHLLLFSTHCGCSFSLCEPLVCSLLLVLTQHWFSCRCSTSAASGRELHSCEWLVESLAAAGWLPVPLCFCAELFQLVTSRDLYLLMSTISNFIKDNLQELRRGALAQLKGTEYKEVLKGVLARNIQKIGHMFAHYIT